MRGLQAHARALHQPPKLDAWFAGAGSRLQAVIIEA